MAVVGNVATPSSLADSYIEEKRDSLQSHAHSDIYMKPTPSDELNLLTQIGKFFFSFLSLNRLSFQANRA